MQTSDILEHKVGYPNWGANFTDMDWAQRMWDAYQIAAQSPDPSTQNGAILYDSVGNVISAECNHFPYGVEYLPERWERPLKYEVIEHAERNSIFRAASMGRATRFGTMVVPWAACSDCARAIIQAGVKRVVRHVQSTERGQGRNWDGTISTADMMFKEAGIEVIDLNWNFAETGKVIDIRHSGEVWNP